MKKPGLKEIKADKTFKEKALEHFDALRSEALYELGKKVDNLAWHTWYLIKPHIVLKDYEINAEGHGEGFDIHIITKEGITVNYYFRFEREDNRGRWIEEEVDMGYSDKDDIDYFATSPKEGRETMLDEFVATANSLATPLDKILESSSG